MLNALRTRMTKQHLNRSLTKFQPAELIYYEVEFNNPLLHPSSASTAFGFAQLSAQLVKSY